MKTLKIIIACVILFNVTGVSMKAQNLSRMEKLNAQKIAFITEKLRLTPDEAQHFWPVYNEYRHQKNAIEQKKNELLRNFSVNAPALTDSEAEKISDQYIQLEKKETDLLVTYHQRFKQVLPVKKVMRLYQVERQFTAYLLQQIRNQRQNMQRGRKRY